MKIEITIKDIGIKIDGQERDWRDLVPERWTMDIPFDGEIVWPPTVRIPSAYWKYEKYTTPESTADEGIYLYRGSRTEDTW